MQTFSRRGCVCVCVCACVAQPVLSAQVSGVDSRLEEFRSHLDRATYGVFEQPPHGPSAGEPEELERRATEEGRQEERGGERAPQGQVMNTER